MLITVAANLASMASIFEDLGKADGKGLEANTPPSEKIIDWLHARASTTARNDLHHRIGDGPTDAASGDHTHNGVDSKPLFTAAQVSLTDLGASPTTADIRAAVNALNAAFRRLGAG